MIRPARERDRAYLESIQSAALSNPWPELLDTAIDGPPRTLVVDEGDRPVGYAIVVPDHPTAYLAELAVIPAKQGHGYGSALLGTLLTQLQAEGFESVRLTSRADDTRVHSFYRSFGFDVTERLPNHYDDGDGIVMIKRF
jgi:ribosomal-protein-alanine N-acetyltransferase